MSSVRIVRDENGDMRAAFSGDLRAMPDSVDDSVAEFKSSAPNLSELKTPEYLPELAASFAAWKTPEYLAEALASFEALKMPGHLATQLDDLCRIGGLTGGNGNDEGHGEKRKRELEVKADFRVWVADPAKAQSPACAISPELRAALIADIAENGVRFQWIGGESMREALCHEIVAKVALSSAKIDEIFPDKRETFPIGNNGFTSINPRQLFSVKCFGLALDFIRCGRILAFGERRGRVIHLEGSLFEDEQFLGPGFSGPSWVERIKPFSPLRFIWAKDAADQFSGRLGPRSGAAVKCEDRAKKAIRQLVATHPDARMKKIAAITLLKNKGFGLNACNRIWDGAAPVTWRQSGRVRSGIHLLSADDLAPVLDQHL